MRSCSWSPLAVAPVHDWPSAAVVAMATCMPRIPNFSRLLTHCYLAARRCQPRSGRSLLLMSSFLMSLPDCRARFCSHHIANIAHVIAWPSESVALTYSASVAARVVALTVSRVMSEKLKVHVDSGYLVKRTRCCVDHNLVATVTNLHSTLAHDSYYCFPHFWSSVLQICDLMLATNGQLAFAWVLLDAAHGNHGGARVCITLFCNDSFTHYQLNFIVFGQGVALSRH
jgi:hypothetical protein